MKHEAMNLVQNTTTGAEANTKRTIDEMAATAVVCHSEIGGEAATDETMSRDNGPAAPMHHDDVHQPVLGGMKPTVEPLKVCLDDDSSIEDGDEDMFDDDAFYFGDEDFEALMSHESMKRPRPGLSRINNAAPVSAALADENSQSPLQHSASMFNDMGGVAASSSSTAASSYGEFSYGRRCHGLFHQHIRITDSYVQIATRHGHFLTPTSSPANSVTRAVLLCSLGVTSILPFLLVTCCH